MTFISDSLGQVVKLLHDNKQTSTQTLLINIMCLYAKEEESKRQQLYFVEVMIFSGIHDLILPYTYNASLPENMSLLEVNPVFLASPHAIEIHV